SGQMPVERVAASSPDSRHSYCDCCKHSEDVPETSRNISLMNVAPDCMGLIFIDYADRILRLAEILARVDANERTRRTVFLARVGSLFSSLRIKRRVVTEITLDREQVIGLRHSGRHFWLSKTEPRS